MLKIYLYVIVGIFYTFPFYTKKEQKIIASIIVFWPFHLLLMATIGLWKLLNIFMYGDKR